MDLKRLSQNAAPIINMLKSVFNTPKGIDIQKALLFASGLAGYACHQAVKANHEPVIVVSTKDKKNFYMGDSVNKYLLEDKYSILVFCNGFFENFAKGESRPDVIEIVKKGVVAIGDENYKIWNLYPPQLVYNDIKSCWNGIYNNMIGACCQKPEEWPVLFGIVLQNMLVLASKVAPKQEIYSRAMECAIYISKMDDDSL